MSSLNSLYNTAIKTSPFECVNGRSPCMNLPKSIEPENEANTPLAYRMNISAKLTHIHKLVIFANQSADLKMEQKKNQPNYTEKISVGDQVLLYRECSAEAKETKLPWLEDQWQVLKENGLVYLIQNTAGVKQWVHRLHLRQLFNRPEHLELPVEVELDSEIIPVPPIIKPTVKQEIIRSSKVEPVNQPPGEPNVGVGRSPVKKKKSRRKKAPPPPRSKSGRTSKPVQRLNIDDSNSKSYDKPG